MVEDYSLNKLQNLQIRYFQESFNIPRQPCWFLLILTFRNWDVMRSLIGQILAGRLKDKLFAKNVKTEGETNAIRTFWSVIFSILVVKILGVHQSKSVL